VDLIVGRRVKLEHGPRRVTQTRVESREELRETLRWRMGARVGVEEPLKDGDARVSL